MKIKVCSLNTRGLKNNTKRNSIFKQCKGFDIINLQESHITDETANKWKLEWGGELFYAAGNTRSKGQIILVNSTVTNIFEDPQCFYRHERILGIKFKMKNEDIAFNIINIYGPNDPQEKHNFFSS